MSGEGFDCARCGTYANLAVYRPTDAIRTRMERSRLCSTCAYSDLDAEIAGFDAKVHDAIDAVTAVLEDPGLDAHQPKRDALLEALRWLEMEVTCGDCTEGRCHFGGERSRAGVEAAKQGRDLGGCGCARHEASIQARDRTRRLRAAGIIPAKGGA